MDHEERGDERGETLLLFQRANQNVIVVGCKNRFLRSQSVFMMIVNFSVYFAYD